MPGRAAVTSASVTQPRARASSAAEGEGDRDGEADGQGPRRAPEEAGRRRTSARPSAAIGDELGTQHHRPDHQDRGVEHDRDRGEQGGQGHERHVGPVELALLVRLLGDVRPHHSVGAAPGCAVLRLESGGGQPGPHRGRGAGSPAAAPRAHGTPPPGRRKPPGRRPPR